MGAREFCQFRKRVAHAGVLLPHLLRQLGGGSFQGKSLEGSAPGLETGSKVGLGM